MIHKQNRYDFMLASFWKLILDVLVLAYRPDDSMIYLPKIYITLIENSTLDKLETWKQNNTEYLGEAY